MAAHANLGPSGAKRWMNCPGSPRLIATLPKAIRDKSSVYADEGSAAHALSEHCLSHADSDGANITRAEKFLGRVIGKPFKDWMLLPEGGAPEGIAGKDHFVVDQGMVDAVQVYLDVIDDYIMSYMVPTWKNEIRVKFTDRDDTWGTADNILSDACEGVLVVTDYKHGAGITVDAEQNEQAKCYALGALRELPDRDTIHTVIVVIVQPRAYVYIPDDAFGDQLVDLERGIKRWEIPAKELLEWGDTIRAAADRTDDPDAPLIPDVEGRGEGYCRFCPAAGICPAIEKMAADTAQLQFDEIPTVPSTFEDKKRVLHLPDPNDPEQLGQAMNTIPLIQFWIKSVESMAHTQLQTKPAAVEHYKMVRASAKRAYKDKAATLEKLRKCRKVKAADYQKPGDLISFGQLMKIDAEVDGKPMKEWVETQLHKPEGALVVVPSSDGRDAVTPAQDDFDEIEGAL